MPRCGSRPRRGPRRPSRARPRPPCGASRAPRRGRRRSARRCGRGRGGQVAPRVLARRQPLRQRPLALDQVVRERAPRPSCSTRCELVRTSRGAARRAPCRRPSSRARSPRAAPARSAGRPPRTASATRRAVPSGAAPFAATSVGTSRGAMHATTRARCLPTQTSPAAGSSSFAPQRKPISSLQRTNVPSGVAHRPAALGAAVHLLPERRQHDVGLRQEQREADLVDEGRCLLQRAHHVSSLQECPRSGRFALCATTRRSPARSTRSSRRRTT